MSTNTRALLTKAAEVFDKGDYGTTDGLTLLRMALKLEHPERGIAHSVKFGINYCIDHNNPRSMERDAVY